MSKTIDKRVPRRIWLLLNEGLDGEHVWSDDPEPSDEGHDAVEYVQAAIADRQPLSGVEEVLKVLEPFAKEAERYRKDVERGYTLICPFGSMLLHKDLRAAADLHARLSAQAGGEKETR